MRDFLLVLADLTTPAFIIWEDFQAGLGSRWEGDGLSNPMAFFTEMDGLFARKSAPICFLLTTNHPEVIPPAAKRKGRNDHEIEFALPDTEARFALLDLFRGPHTTLSEDAAAAARSLAGLAGSDLREIMVRAKLAIIERDPDCKEMTVTALT